MEFIAGDKLKRHDSLDRELVELAGKRAGNFFEVHKLCCAEAVLLVLNQAFRGDLAPEMAVRLGSGFCHGMGGAGCTCGALAGAEMILSVLLGPHQAGGIKKKEFEEISKEMHDRFKDRFGVTCCRVLMKRRKEKKAPSCQELTVGGAEMAAALVLESKPELAARVDMEFLRVHDSKLAGLAKRLLGKRPC